jgi:alkylation response protein AidB-like acyl-CoA dehydrogenase
MRRLALVMLAALIAGTTAAIAGDLPEGTFSSSEAGCDVLKTKTPEELGEDLDFYVLNKKGMTTYAQHCDFVSVTARDDKSWLANAFCDEDGYVYPDLFAIADTATGGLVVSRLTDITQQRNTETELPLSEDMDPSELDRDDTAEETESSGTEEPATKPDGFNHYFLCPDVKP